MPLRSWRVSAPPGCTPTECVGESHTIKKDPLFSHRNTLTHTLYTQTHVDVHTHTQSPFEFCFGERERERERERGGAIHARAHTRVCERLRAPTSKRTHTHS